MRQWGKYNLFNKLCWEKWTDTYAKESNLITVLHTIQKVKLKLIRELNISAETINS